MNHPISRLRRFSLLSIASLLFVLVMAVSATADEGEPVAVRFWPGEGVTIETMWNLHVGLRINAANRVAIRRVPDVVLTDAEQPLESKGDDKQMQVHNWNEAEGSSYVLDRLPNTDAATWKMGDESEKPSSNAVRISKLVFTSSGSKDPLVISKIEVDGVTIVDARSTADVFLKAIQENVEPAKAIQNVDALLLSHPKNDAESCAQIAKLLAPSTIVLSAAGAFEKIGDVEVTKVSHNTIALSKPKSRPDGTRWVALADQTWTMPEEVATLFQKKEAACADSRGLFAKLSVKQLNFKPSNGTHTPRWNTEHMMGRELQFFSQIYGAVDPSIREINLNPKQMPKDYEFKHPDWTGVEEAEQTVRVEEFTRRFAYLLEGMDLDKRAKGSRFWTPRRLLKQMERHYKEHTDNVRKKMKLAEWPSE